MTGVPAAGRPALHVVCRANRARSPLVAAVLARLRDERGPGATERPIRDGGLWPEPGAPLLRRLGPLLLARGVDLAGHVARPADLADDPQVWAVITFETELKRSILMAHPRLGDRTFTLREIVRLASSDRWQPQWNGSADVIARLHVARPYVDSGDDESPDPVRRGSRRGLLRTVNQLWADTERVADVLWGPAGQVSEGATGSSARCDVAP